MWILALPPMAWTAWQDLRERLPSVWPDVDIGDPSSLGLSHVGGRWSTVGSVHVWALLREFNRDCGSVVVADAFLGSVDLASLDPEDCLIVSKAGNCGWAGFTHMDHLGDSVEDICALDTGIS